MAGTDATAERVTTAGGRPARPGWRWRAALLVLVLLAGALRLQSALGDEPFIDELWSLHLLRDVTAPWQVFAVRHDNNHPLNSMLMLALRDAGDWRLLRLPAVLAGTAAVGLLGLLAARFGPAVGLLAAFLAAVAWPLTYHCAEARGYGLALLAAVAAARLQAAGRARPRPALALALGVVLALGLLAHLAFVLVWLPMLLWACLGDGGRPPGRRWRPPAAVAGEHALPAAVALGLAVGFLPGMTVGGCNDGGWRDLLGQLAGFLAPAGGATGAALLLVGLGLAALGLVGDDDGGTDDGDFPARWRSFLALVLLVPALLLPAMRLLRPVMLQGRYLLDLAPFVVLLIARGLVRLAGGRGPVPAWGRWLGVAALVAWLSGAQLAQTARLAAVGRGHYRAALQRMAQLAPAGELSVGGDLDLRHSLPVAALAPLVLPERALAYYFRSQWPASGPRFVLTHDNAPQPASPTPLTDPRGNRYLPVGAWPWDGVNGWNLYLHQNAADRAAPR